MNKVAVTVATLVGAALAPAVCVQGIIALRTNYKQNCATDAWMAHDFRLWANEIRATR